MSGNESLMEQIRGLGRLPTRSKTVAQDKQQLAKTFRRARAAGKLSAEEKAELATMSANDSLMQAIRTLGRLPKETTFAYKHERRLAGRLRYARRTGKLSNGQEAELAAMSANVSVMQGHSNRMEEVRHHAMGRLQPLPGSGSRTSTRCHGSSRRWVEPLRILPRRPP